MLHGSCPGLKPAADPASWLAAARLSGPLAVGPHRRIDDLAAWQRLALEQLAITAGEPPPGVWPEGWRRRRRVLLAQIEDVKKRVEGNRS